MYPRSLNSVDLIKLFGKNMYQSSHLYFNVRLNTRNNAKWSEQTTMYVPFLASDFVGCTLVAAICYCRASSRSILNPFPSIWILEL